MCTYECSYGQNPLVLWLLGSPDVGRGPKASMYVIYLCDYSMGCVFLCLYAIMFICWYAYILYQAGPDVTRGQVIDIYVYRAGLNAARGPMSNGVQCRAWPNMWFYVCLVCGILGNSLSFVFMVSRLCFRYFSFQMEELVMVAGHKPHVFRILWLLSFHDVLVNLGYHGFTEMIYINDLFI